MQTASTWHCRNFGQFWDSWLYLRKKRRKWHFPLEMCKNVRLSWKLVTCSEMILLSEMTFTKKNRWLFNYLIAEKWLLMDFTIGKKKKNRRFFEMVFFMFFVAPYTSNSLRSPKKKSIFFEIFEKKNFNNFGRNFLASWFYYRKKTHWKTLFVETLWKGSKSIGGHFLQVSEKTIFLFHFADGLNMAL